MKATERMGEDEGKGDKKKAEKCWKRKESEVRVGLHETERQVGLVGKMGTDGMGGERD